MSEQQQRRRLSELAVGVAVVALALGIALSVTLLAARTANNSADRADRAARCTTLILQSVADQTLTPDLHGAGCDVAIALQLIARGRARDHRVTVLEGQLRANKIEPLPESDTNGDGDGDLGASRGPDATRRPSSAPSRLAPRPVAPLQTSAPGGPSTPKPTPTTRPRPSRSATASPSPVAAPLLCQLGPLPVICPRSTP